MKKEDLTAMGLTEEQAQKVMQSLDGNFVTKTRFNEVNEENKTLKQSVSDRDKQLETLKKENGDNAELKQQIADLQKQNAEQNKAHEAEMSKLKLDNAVEAALIAAGAKNTKAVRSLFENEKISLGEDGSVSGIDEQIAAVKKSDPYMFGETNNTKNFKGLVPGASGDIKPTAKADMSKMSYDELTAYIENNPDAVNN